MKSVIYEFDPVIYPTRLWVGKNIDDNEFKELFYPLNEDGEVIDNCGNVFSKTGVYATTVMVGHKESHMRGCIVNIAMPRMCGAGVCAHEALHYVAYLSEQFEIALGGFNGSEPIAYLLQWATNCIWCTLIGRPDSMKGEELCLGTEVAEK